MLACCLICSFAAAQLDSLEFYAHRGINNANYFAEDTYLSRGAAEKRVEGSLFLEAQWQEARILTPQNEVVAARARYRIYDEEMQVLGANNEVLALYPAKVRAVAIGRQVFVPLEYQDKQGGATTGFFQLLVEGEASLLLRREMELVHGDYNPALNIGDRNDHFEARETYYYRYQKGKLQLLRLNKKAVLDALGRRKKAVAEYARASNLGFRKQEEIVALFQFYNRS